MHIPAYVCLHSSRLRYCHSQTSPQLLLPVGERSENVTAFLEHLQVKKHPVLQNQQHIIPAVARVLAWSQWYMRNREVGYDRGCHSAVHPLYTHTSALTS